MKDIVPAQWRLVLTSLLVGSAGALLFWLIGFPSAPLTGAAAAVTVASLSGVKTDIPPLIRNIAFVLLGVNIGTAATPDMLTSATRWPFSLLVLMVCLTVSLLVTRFTLQKFFKYDRQSAGLAGVPGHLSYVLSLSMDTKADTATIAIVQSVRVLFITLGVPLVVTFGFGPTGIDVLPETVMTIPSIVLAFGVTFLVGLAFTRFRVPAAFLLAGMIVSAGLHLTDITPGRLPTPLSFASFLIMGTLIGSRFSSQTWRSVGNAISAGIWVTVVNFATALAGIMIVSFTVGLPPAEVFVAFVPGGVEAMAAIAIMMGLDPTYVAAHHLLRLLFLTLLIPIVLRPKS